MNWKSREGALEAARTFRRLTEEGGYPVDDQGAATLALTSSQALADRHFPPGTETRTRALQTLDRVLDHEQRFPPHFTRDGRRLVQETMASRLRLTAVRAAALASSRELLDAHVGSPAEVHQLLGTLTDHLDRREHDIRRASGHGVQARNLTAYYEGITNLFEHRGDELLTHALADDAARDARVPALEEALSRTLYAPELQPDQRDRISDSLVGYIEREMAEAGPEAPTRGLALGHLMGALHNAGDLALNRSDTTQVRGFAEDFFGRYAGKVAGAVVSRFSGPLGLVVDPAINTLLRPEVDTAAAAARAEAEFRERLAEAGGDVAAGRILDGQIAQDLAERLVTVNEALLEAQDRGESPEAISALRDLQAWLEQMGSGIGRGYGQARQRRLRAQ